MACRLGAPFPYARSGMVVRHRILACFYVHAPTSSCRAPLRIPRAVPRVVASKLKVSAYLGDQEAAQQPAATETRSTSISSGSSRAAYYLGAAAAVGLVILLRPRPAPTTAVAKPYATTTTVVQSTTGSSSSNRKQRSAAQASATPADAEAASAIELAGSVPVHFAVKTGMALPVVDQAEVELLDVPYKQAAPLAGAPLLLVLAGMAAAAAAAAAVQAQRVAQGSSQAQLSLTSLMQDLPALLGFPESPAAAGGGLRAAAAQPVQGQPAPTAAAAAHVDSLTADAYSLLVNDFQTPIPVPGAAEEVVPAPDAWIHHVSGVRSALQQGEALTTSPFSSASGAASVPQQAPPKKVWGQPRPPSEAAQRTTELLQAVLDLPDGSSTDDVLRLVKGPAPFDFELDAQGYQLGSVLRPDKMAQVLQALAWRMQRSSFLALAQQLLASYPAPHLLLAHMQLQGSAGGSMALSQHLLSDLAGMCPGPRCARPADTRSNPFDATASAAAALSAATHPFTQQLSQLISSMLADAGFPQMDRTADLEGSHKLAPGAWMNRAQAVEVLRWLCAACPTEQLLPLLAQLPAKEVRKLMPVIQQYDQAAPGEHEELSRQQQMLALASIYRQHLLLQQSKQTGPAMQGMAAPAAQAAVLRALCIDYWQQSLKVIDRNMAAAVEEPSAAASAAPLQGQIAQKLPAQVSTTLLDKALLYVSDVELADCTYLDGRVSPSHDTVSGQHLLLQDVVDAVRAELQVFDHAAYLGVDTTATFSQEYWPLLRVLLEQLALHWQLPRAERMRMVLRELLPQPVLASWAHERSLGREGLSPVPWDVELAGVASLPAQQKLLQGSAATYLAAVSGRAMSGGNPLLGSKAAWEDGVHLAQTMLLLREVAGEMQQGLGAALVANAHPQHLLVAAAALPVAAAGSSTVVTARDGMRVQSMDWKGVLQEFVDGAAIINRSRSVLSSGGGGRGRTTSSTEASIASWAWTASLIKQLVQFAATAASDTGLASTRRGRGSPEPSAAEGDDTADGSADGSASSSNASLSWSEHRLAKQARELYAQSCLLVSSELLALVVDRTAALHLPGWLQQVASVAQLWQRTAESVLRKAVPPLLKWGPGTEVIVSDTSSWQLLEPLKDMLTTAGRLSQQLLPQAPSPVPEDSRASSPEPSTPTVMPDKVLGPGEQEGPQPSMEPGELLQHIPRMVTDQLVVALEDMAGRVGAGAVLPGPFVQCVQASAVKLKPEQSDHLIGVLAERLSLEDFLLCSRPLMPRGADIPMTLQQLVWRWQCEEGLKGLDGSEVLERRRRYLQAYVEVYYGRSLKL